MTRPGSMGPETPFAARLEVARRQLAHAARSSLPPHEQDQVACAARDAGRAATELAWLLPLAQPERGWRQTTTAFDPERTAHLWAGLLGCNACVHLRREGPQPAFCALPLRRLDCQRCAGTIRRPPPGEGDRCDLCGDRGVVYFVPLFVRSGPLLVAGDVCTRCARVLGLDEAAA